jgi:hypothetical protein
MRNDSRGMRAGREARGVSCLNENTCKNSPHRQKYELRPIRPVIQVAGITGYDRLLAGIPVRDVRGMKRSGRSFAPKPTTKSANVQVLYGSDGLEPATSGVTGRHGATGHSRL